MSTAAVATVVGLLASVWVAVPAEAAGKWSQPKTLSSTDVTSIPIDGSRYGPAIQVRTDGAGNAVATWIQDINDVCQAKWATRQFGGAWSAPRSLAPVMDSCPIFGGGLMSLAMNKNGRAVVAWVDDNVAVAAIRPAGGSFGTPVTMPASDTTVSVDVTTAINATGTVAVAWTEPTFTIGSPTPLKARVRPAGGAYSSVETLTTAGGAAAPKLLVEPSGAVTAAWARAYSLDFSTTHFAIETAYRPVGEQFQSTPDQTLDDYVVSSGGLADVAPQLAADANTRTTAVWVQETGSKRIVRSASKTVGSATFGTAQSVNASDTGNAKLPRLAVDRATNTAVVVWLQCGASCTVRSAVRPNAGGYGNLQTISGALPTNVWAPVVDITSAGAAVAAWSGAPNGSGADRVATAVRPKGGSFGAEAFISGPVNGSIDDNGPAIATDAKGNAVVLWAHVNGTTSATVRYSDYLSSWYRPDALIKKASASSYLGAKVYNTTGQHQIVSAKAARGHSVTFDIKVINRSTAYDAITVKGPGGKPGFSVKYLAGASGSTDITKQVVAGSYSPRLAPGAGKVLRLVVKAKAGAIVGSADYWSVRATSSHDATRKDVVKASVTVKG
jgi:hypothetical protein